jgi:hypothetical protein
VSVARSKKNLFATVEASQKITKAPEVAAAMTIGNVIHPNKAAPMSVNVDATGRDKLTDPRYERKKISRDNT